jgi:nucleoside-diphosphate-sugar epimerase
MTRIIITGVSSQRILLTGATGFVGKALHTELISQGHNICAATRADKYKRNNVVSVGDVDGTTDWSKVLRDVNTVIHLAARVHVMKDANSNSLAAYRQVNVTGTLNLARQATQAGVKRFIFISSVKVNGEYSEIGRPFTEKCVANPQDAYGQSKLEAEQGLLLLAKQTAMEMVIIRPPLVYGNGVGANFHSLLRAIRIGIPLPLGAIIHNKRSFVYIGNLVSFILRCLDHPSAVGQVFLVSDGLDLSTKELLKRCAVALGVKSRLWPLPQRLIENLASMVGKGDEAQRLCGSLQVDISKARALLGWTPPFSVEDGLKATALGLKGD